MPRRTPTAGIAQLHAIQDAIIQRECTQLLNELSKATHIGVLTLKADSCQTLLSNVCLYAHRSKLQALKQLWPELCRALAASLALLDRHWQQQQQQQQQQLGDEDFAQVIGERCCHGLAAACSTTDATRW
jgi:hypothetical protein